MTYGNRYVDSATRGKKYNSRIHSACVCEIQETSSREILCALHYDILLHGRIATTHLGQSFSRIPKWLWATSKEIGFGSSPSHKSAIVIQSLQFAKKMLESTAPVNDKQLSSNRKFNTLEPTDFDFSSCIKSEKKKVRFMDRRLVYTYT